MEIFQIVGINNKDGTPKTDPSSLLRLNKYIDTDVYKIRTGFSFVGVYRTESKDDPLHFKMLVTSNVINHWYDHYDHVWVIETENSVYRLKSIGEVVNELKKI